MFDNKEVSLVTRLPWYLASRATRNVIVLPMNYTLGLTYNCNSRCKTCRVYEREKVEELSVKEWREVFKSIGKSPYWVTFTGGEPFLYHDFLEVYYDLCEICQPSMVNVPTNGLLTERIVDWVWQLCKLEPRIKVTVNVSIDHIGKEHDIIRGVPGAFDKAVTTVKALKALSLDNLSVGIHTVISKFNVLDFPYIYDSLYMLPSHPDLYISEVAENRVELGTTELNISPMAVWYSRAVECVSSPRTLKGLLRSEYYTRVSKWLEHPGRASFCYAGYASCQITPNGDVWFCCVRAKSVGNIREQDFREIWTGKAARSLRKDNKCSCPLANVAYTNMLLDPVTITKLALRRVCCVAKAESI